MKSKKGPTIVLIITALILVIFVILEMFSNDKETNVTVEQTKQSLIEFQQKYDTKYLTITLKDKAKVGVVEEIAKKYKATIISSEEEIKNYTIEFEKQLESGIALTILEEIMETKGVADTSYLLNEESQGIYFNSDNPENDKVFEAAISNYQAPVSVYYNEKGIYTFLYPSEYVLEASKGKIDIGGGRISISPYKPSGIGIMEEAVNDIIGENINNEFVKESYAMYDTDFVTVISWFDGELYKGIMQDEKGYYEISAVDEKEFVLLTESFYIN